MSSLYVSVFYCGSAAAQCGKALPYRLNAIWILRRCLAWSPEAQPLEQRTPIR